MADVEAPYVLVMCAMEEEAVYLRDRMNDCSELPLTGAMRRTRGSISSVVVDLVISGIGGVYATMATTAAILDRRPTAVFSCGCSGAHVRELRMGDVVLASAVNPMSKIGCLRSSWLSGGLFQRTRSYLGLLQAPASLGQLAALAALGHLGLDFIIGQAA